MKGLPITIGALLMCASLSTILSGQPCLLLLRSSFQSVRSQKEDRFLTSPIDSFDQLASLVTEVRRGNLPNVRLIAKIKKGGLKFDITEEQIQRLQAAGANNDIAKLLRSLVVRPPTPRPKRTGSLIVSCEPVDCTFFVDGEAMGSITGGNSQPIQSVEGSHKVTASASGYNTDQQERSIEVPPDGTITVPYRFNPTRQAYEDAGKKIYEGAVSALGGEGVLASASRFSAKGTMDLSDHEGRQSTWDLSINYKGPDTAKFVLHRGNRTYTATYNSREGYRWQKPPAEASSLEDVLFRVCQFQVANILGQVGTSRFTLVAKNLTLDRAAPASNTTLRAEGALDTYVVELEPNGLVKEIQIESSSFNNGLRAVYGNYTSGAGLLYAKLTRILLPDKRGIEVRFADLKYSPSDLTDEVFQLDPKKKRK